MVNVFLNWIIPGLFFSFFAKGWIRITDLWSRNRPLYQLRHNHHHLTFIKSEFNKSKLDQLLPILLH